VVTPATSTTERKDTPTKALQIRRVLIRPFYGSPMEQS
jgi:hypothetical protein